MSIIHFAPKFWSVFLISKLYVDKYIALVFPSPEAVSHAKSTNLSRSRSLNWSGFNHLINFIPKHVNISRPKRQKITSCCKQD